MKRRIGILIALYLLNILSSQVFSQAPPPNPVFVNDSAEAARLLARARDLTTTNPAETVRLIQIVLDEHQDMLVPDPEENGRFESARSVALGILSTDDALLKRYDRAESRRAREMLEEGRLRGLVETRSATRAGLEALLLLAQQNLEAGRLAIADSWLEEALAHHLMTDEDRWAAWLMRGMASHGRGHQTAVEDMTRRLEEAGPEAEPWYEAMMAWTSRNPPSPLQSRDMLDATDQSVGDLLEPSLWNAAYARTPVSILSNSEFSEELIEANTLSGRLTAIVPAIVDDRIYFNEGAEVARVNLFTGLEDWRTSILDPSNRTDRINDPIGPTTVAVDGDDLVTWIGYSMAGGTSESKEVVCLDTRTGDERWRFNLADTKGVDDPQSLYPAGPVVIHEDRVFVIARRERRQGLKSCYLRPLAFVGEGAIGVAAMGNPTNVAIAAWPWGAYLGDEGLTRGVRIKTSTFVRPHVNSQLHKGKVVGHYVNSILAKREALMDRLGQKRTAGHTKGAARREPYPLRRQADAVHAAETVAQWDDCWRQEVVFLPPIFQATARSKMTTMNLTSPRHLDTASAANDRESEVLGIHTLPDIPVLTHDDAAAASRYALTPAAPDFETALDLLRNDVTRLCVEGGVRAPRGIVSRDDGA